ncbi:MAG: hypothetical protein SOU51_03245 [Collinsella sp.]|nr:hypothetical protein [Collinsella sp.]
MDPSRYVPAYLEQAYIDEHDELTPAARELLHDEIARHPETYATSDHARALLSYARTHAHLHAELIRMEGLSDEEFDRKRARLFDETRMELMRIWQGDRLCVDARLLDILLANVPLDDCLVDLIHLEREVRDELVHALGGFDPDVPGFWISSSGSPLPQEESALKTATNPVVIGWLHIVEALAQGSIASGRYRAGASYARIVMRSEGYPNLAVGTLLLALARLEDEDAFFACIREADPDLHLDDSPWYLLARTILLYKLGRRKNARRALRDFAARCDGGAFFLLNPTYLTPYLPVRPAVSEPWELTHQAIWEADGIIADTPDFVLWAEGVEGVMESSEHFADRNGF